MPFDKIMISCGTMDFQDDQENHQPFKGILCTLDEASARAPISNIGKRAVITRAAAEKAMASIAGQPVNVAWNAPDGKFSGHDKTVVGIFTKGWVQDNEVWVEGYLFNETLPKICASIKQEKNNLGFSYEILAKSYTTKGDEMVIDDFTFIGGAILYKNKAAYGDSTQLVAAQTKENDMMTPEEIKGIIEGVTSAFDEKFAKISASIDEKIKGGMDGITGDLAEVKAAAAKAKEDMESLAVNLAETKAKVEASAEPKVEPDVPAAEPPVEPVKAAAVPPAPTVIQAGQKVASDPNVKPQVTKEERIKAAKEQFRKHEISVEDYTRKCVRINAGIEE